MEALKIAQGAAGCPKDRVPLRAQGKERRAMVNKTTPLYETERGGPLCAGTRNEGGKREKKWFGGGKTHSIASMGEEEKAYGPGTYERREKEDGGTDRDRSN